MNKEKKYIKAINQNGLISIPAPIREELGLDSGDHLEVKIKGNVIVLTPVKIVAA